MFSYKTISVTDARKGFSHLLDQVVEDQVLINQQEGENVALIAESDLTSLVEIYLLKSAANARRLLDAITSLQLKIIC